MLAFGPDEASASRSPAASDDLNDSLFESVSDALTFREVLDLFVSTDMLGLDSRADRFEKTWFEEQCREKRQTQLIRSAVQSISSLDTHAEHVWEAAACLTADTLELPQSGHGDWRVTYLRRFGYAPLDAEHWEQAAGLADTSPTMVFHIGNADQPEHVEHAGHTWYMIQCELIPKSLHIPLKCLAPRRLMHLREILQEPLMVLLDAEYSSLFWNAPFPLRTGPPGTTSRLRVWLSALAESINAGKLPPGAVAWVLAFFLPRKLGPTIVAPRAVQELDATLSTLESHTGGVAIAARDFKSRAANKRSSPLEPFTQGLDSPKATRDVRSETADATSSPVEPFGSEGADLAITDVHSPHRACTITPYSRGVDIATTDVQDVDIATTDVQSIPLFSGEVESEPEPLSELQAASV